jgi:hypothetical protein
MSSNKDNITIKNTYLITINKELIHEYHQHYMKKHPTARTYPFAKEKTIKLFNKDGSPQLTKGGKQKTKKIPISKKDYTINDCIYGTMSLNELLIINNRMTMNGIKQKWGDFGIWLAKKFNLNDLQISNALTEYRVFGETNAQRDADNISAGIKILNDGLYVKSKMFIDDNWKYINPLLITLDFDKEHPRTEIRISTFDNNIKDVYEKLKIHIENFKEI